MIKLYSKINCGLGPYYECIASFITSTCCLQAKEIQDEQRALLDDILKQQMEETDPEKLTELQEQQNILIQQMQTFQASGFQYEGGIPQGQGHYLPQAQPMELGQTQVPNAPDQLYQA